MRIRPHEKLIVWQEAYKLCLWIYKQTAKFPSSERYSLALQMRRSAYSVPMNIAEGNARRTQKEQNRFVEIAISSLEELHCQLRLSKDLLYIDQSVFESTANDIGRVGYLLNQFRKSKQ